ncbi:MAG: hypothetical protein V9H26_05095 [Verrucomicrobiota bacterium]
MTLNQVQHELQDPPEGRAVTVEFIVRFCDDHRTRWSFRYLWADWSITVDFAGDEESWGFFTKGAGPRTELQLRTLHELANHLRIRDSARPFVQRWSELRECLWGKQPAATSHPESTPLQEQEEVEIRAAIKMKLGLASLARSWRKKHDPETVVLESFLQRLISAELVCDVFNLDQHKVSPLLVALQSAYERLVDGALACRSNAIRNAFSRGRITLDQASDLFKLDWPVTEHILNVKIGDHRGGKALNRPSKKRLLKSIHAIKTAKSAGVRNG